MVTFFLRLLPSLNLAHQPGLFEDKMVHSQLAYLGVTETIRIRKLGYPYSSSFFDFSRRYRCFHTGNTMREFDFTFPFGTHFWLKAMELLYVKGKTAAISSSLSLCRTFFMHRAPFFDFKMLTQNTLPF